MGSFIGSRVRRTEGDDKASGRALYVADLDVPGAWWGGAVRAEVPHGRILGFDFDPDFDFESVCIVRPEDVPGENLVAAIVDDQPLLCAQEISHWGEPLLLVAAAERGLLRRALAAIQPRIEELEPTLDPELSTEVFKEITIEKGDARSRLGSAQKAPAERVIEGTYFTDSQEQMYIEPQGFVAWPADGEGTVVVKGSLQCPHYVQKALMRALDLDERRARVVQAVTGGGFGGKEDYPSVIACQAALCARAAGRPVKFLFDRHEDLAVTPKRHPARVTHRTAVDEDGKLLAMEVDLLLDGGAYTTLSPVVLSRACIHAAGAYRCDHIRIRGRVVKTHHVPYGAFRGFGAPQVCFAVERQMDRTAHALGLHPAEVRRKNQLLLGDTTATGQLLTESVGSKEVLERVLTETGFASHEWRGLRPETGRKRRGMGLAFFFHGSGFTGSGEKLLQAEVAVGLLDDGRAEVRTSSTEFGQGTLTMLLTIAADALESRLDEITFADPDTRAVPDSGPTVASRTCMIVGGSLARACRELRRRIEEKCGQEGSFSERARRFLATGGDPLVRMSYANPPGLKWDETNYRGDAYPAYGWAADIAEVEVDLDTFEVEVTRFVTAVDVGKAIQPSMVEGQIEGGSLQAIGFAHREVVETRAGRFRQDRMATCVIPTTLDAPTMEVFLVEKPFSNGPGGAKGIGELPMDGGAPAVVSAIEDALGIALDRVPATPERIARAWLAAHPEEAL